MQGQKNTITPPDGGWGWIIVFGSFMIHVINDGITYSFGMLYEDFLKYFNSHKSETAWILSILYGMTYCSGPIAGILVNKYGCRAVTLGGTILAAFSFFVSFWANSIIALCVTLGFGGGLGFGLVYLPAIVSVTVYFEKKRSLATGIAVCGSGIGTFIFPTIIYCFMELYSWQGVMIVLSGIVLQCIVFGTLFRPLKNEKCIKKNKIKNIAEYINEKNYVTKSLQPEEFELRQINNNSEKIIIKKKLFDVTLFKDVTFILFVISNVLTSIGFNVPFIYIVPRALSLDIPLSHASLLLAIIGIANTLGRIILGYISDKPWINRLWVYNSCLTICGFATALSVFATDFYSLLVYALIFGLTVGAYVGLTSVILVDLLGVDKITNAFGILLFFQGIASFIGPPIGGMFYDILESFDPGFFMAGIAIALSGLMLFFLPFIKRKLSKNIENCNEEL
ncbi:monocarboxylate transporter 5-like [Onthophagus taurus]|uniref:monocarboxylate transporter 5-like n=1 Tax=Onthophagus taurus TaxID=166361 RepID=UPI0039BDCEC0